MIKMRYCTSCQTEKPADGFTVEEVGRGGRHKMHRCADCTASRKLRKSVSERDAFGRSVSERNRALMSAQVRHKLNANTQSMIKDY